MSLAIPERDRLTECEQTIERGLGTFVEVGQALMAIRDERLYRASHDAFDDYCRERWNIERTYAHRIIEGAQVAAALPIGNRPSTEGQARELARVPEPERADIWHEAVERTEGKPTAAAIRQVRQERQQPQSLPASEAVTEFLESDEDLRSARYLHEFMKALTRSDDFMEFDPSKLAEFADAELVRTVDDYGISVRNFIERFHRARPGLQVIHGG